VPPPAYGGTERVVSTLAEELTGRGHHVTLFAVGGSLTAAELVTTVDEPPRMGGEGSFADDLFHTLSAYRRAAEFDVIHDHTGLGPALGAMLRRMPPVVHTLHGPWTATSRRFYGLVDDRIALVAISRSQAMANPQVRYGGIVYNGIDLGAHPFSADKHDYLAYVGRVSPEKGTATAVEVARGAGRPLKMVVKRREQPEWDYWNEVVAPLLTPDVEVLEQPSHEVKCDVLAHARATLFPIDWPEPFGLVMVESLACGTPVIARPLGAAPEIVQAGVSGLFADSVTEMIEAVARVGDLDPLACRARAARRFSAQTMTDGYEQVYAAALRGTASAMRAVWPTRKARAEPRRLAMPSAG